RQPEEVVERALLPERAVYELGREGTVAGVESRVAQHRREHDVGVRAVLDAHQSRERRLAAAHESSTASTGTTRSCSPAIHACPVMRGLPSGCTSSSPRTPSAVTSSPGRRTTPGWPSPGSGRARQTLT